MNHSKLLHHTLEDSALRTPDAPALLVGSEFHSYAELNDTADRLARLLRARGVRRGDRVAVLLENSYGFVASYYAALKAGAAVVPLNTSLLAADLRWILGDCQPVALVTTRRWLARLEADDAPIEIPTLLWGLAAQAEGTGADPLPDALAGMPRGAPELPPGQRPIDLDLAAIVYTSGSTGRPRGVALSHLNLLTNTRSIVDYLHLGAGDRMLVVLPFYYIYGASLLNTHVLVGASLALENRVAFPQAVIESLASSEATGFAGVPSSFTMMLQRSTVREMTFPHLRYLTQAGGPMPPAVQKEVAEIFAPAELFVMYGATEASARLGYLSPADLERKWGAIGRGIPNVDLFVADQHGTRLPAGERGELVARGANISKGYWNNPEDSARAFRHGLFFTGDLGVEDDEGFLYVVGRSKDMIKVGGNAVSSVEIEQALHEFEAVADAAVIGVPDELLGEALKAFVVWHEGAEDEAALLAFLRGRLPSYKVPQQLEAREALPKTGAGKIDKLALRGEREAVG